MENKIRKKIEIKEDKRSYFEITIRVEPERNLCHSGLLFRHNEREEFLFFVIMLAFASLTAKSFTD